MERTFGSAILLQNLPPPASRWGFSLRHGRGRLTRSRKQPYPASDGAVPRVTYRVPSTVIRESDLHPRDGRLFVGPPAPALGYSSFAGSFVGHITSNHPQAGRKRFEGIVPMDASIATRLVESLDKFLQLKKAVPWLIGAVVLRHVPTVCRQLLDLIPYAAHAIRQVPIRWRLTGINGDTAILKAEQKRNLQRSQSALSPLSQPHGELPVRASAAMLAMPDKTG
jgi:hypothetical protein